MSYELHLFTRCWHKSKFWLHELRWLRLGAAHFVSINYFRLLGRCLFTRECYNIFVVIIIAARTKDLCENTFKGIN